MKQVEVQQHQGHISGTRIASAIPRWLEHANYSQPPFFWLPIILINEPTMSNGEPTMSNGQSGQT